MRHLYHRIEVAPQPHPHPLVRGQKIRNGSPSRIHAQPESEARWLLESQCQSDIVRIWAKSDVPSMLNGWSWLVRQLWRVLSRDIHQQVCVGWNKQLKNPAETVALTLAR